MHEGLATSRRRPFFDGTYLTWSDLAGDPTFAVAQGGVHEGQWKAADASPCSPVAWHEVAWHGVTVRGPERGDIEVWTDTSTLVRWTRGNMASYWRTWHADASRTFSKLGVASLGSWAPAWGVLGVARQRYTIDTGLITSKYGAGLYARDLVDPRWRRIVDECLRIRSGSSERTAYASPFARRRDALDFMKSSMDEIIGPAR